MCKLNYSPGVNFGANAEASANGDEFDVVAVSAYFEVELVGDDGPVPYGRQRLRFAGR